MSPRTAHRTATVLIAASLLSACAAEGEGGGPDIADVTALPTGDPDAATEWALGFTGGVPGVAEGAPYRIGFAHSSDIFPEGDASADATVGFINQELGGIGGRPIELVRCNVVTPDDGATCGATLANDEEIDLVIAGLMLGGNAELYDSLAGHAVAVIALPLDIADFTTEHGVAFNTGALGSGLGGAAFLAEDLNPKTAALVVTDDVAGRAANEAFRPIVEAAGIELRQVFVPPTATSPEIAGALQAAGAATADVLVAGLFEPGCIATYDALRSLDITPDVVATAACWGTAMQAHMAGLGEEHPVPNGWHFGWFGYGLFGDDVEPGIAAFHTKSAEHGAGDIAASIAAAPIWDALLTATRILNEIGDDVTYETVDAALHSYTGPSIIQSGNISCGAPPFISVCATEVSIVQYLDGKWLDTRTGSTGAAIDLAPYLRPAT